MDDRSPSAASRSARLKIAVIAVVFVLIAVSALLIRLGTAPEETNPGAKRPKAQAAVLDLPPPAKQGYVGSAECASCHAEVANAYHSHGMSRAAAPINEAAPIEDYVRNVSFKSLDGREYRVEKTAEGVFHHEIARDAQGEVIYDHSVPIHWTIGSGRGGRSYLSEKGGIFYQSPISWYVEKNAWDLSPGYDTNPNLIFNRFERRIPDGCIACHTGRAAPTGNQADRFLNPAIIEGGISCERCHGPGAEHVEARKKNAAAPVPDATIVNPARLEPLQREAVCNQCHLLSEPSIPRFGRTVYDYRPGEMLEETWVALAQSELGEQKAVSHVEQIRQSRCYIESNERLGCITCHDAHERAAPPARAALMDQKCATCHAQRGCTEPVQRRGQKSCVECHMPRDNAVDIAHAAQTDHRISRRPGTHDYAPRRPDSMSERIALFDDAQTRLPPWELDRVEGLILFQAMDAESNYERKMVLLDRADQLLRKANAVASNDVPVLFALGTIRQIRTRPDDARGILEGALRLDPRNGRILTTLIAICNDRTDFDSAVEFARRLSEAYPHESQSHERLAGVLRFTNERADAVAEFEKTLELNPLNVKARSDLIKELESLGRKEEAGRHKEILRRLQATLPVK